MKGRNRCRDSAPKPSAGNWNFPRKPGFFPFLTAAVTHGREVYRFDAWRKHENSRGDPLNIEWHADRNSLDQSKMSALAKRKHFQIVSGTKIQVYTYHGRSSKLLKIKLILLLIACQYCYKAQFFFYDVHP